MLGAGKVAHPLRPLAARGMRLARAMVAGAQSCVLPSASLTLQRRWSSSRPPASPQERKQQQSSTREGASRGRSGNHSRSNHHHHHHSVHHRPQQTHSPIQPSKGNVAAIRPAPPPLQDGEAPLPRIQELLARRDYDAIEQLVDASYDPQTQSLIDFCVNVCDARDTVLTLMRVYVQRGRMDKVRRIFLAALRDLSNPAGLDEPDSAGEAEQPSLLNVSVFNGYLEALTRRRNYDKDEVVFVLEKMREEGVSPDALTYHYLIELHIRAGYDPQPLWHEAFHERRGLTPLPATVQAVLLRVVPHSTDSRFTVEVVRAALRCGAAVLDKRTLAELVGRWLRDTSRTSPALRPSSSPPPSRGGRQAESAAASATASSTVAAAAKSPSSPSPPRYPPECILWLMLELEVRCVLDKASFVQYIHKQHIAELLLSCAKSADATTAAEALALMDRHVMTKTADVLALVVWCWAQAGELERALDMLELMARKGYLELTDAMRKYHVECLQYTMDRNFLALLADAISASPAQHERALRHLRARRQRGLPVSVHALDVLVLAAGKLGEERAALQLALSYEAVWGVQPRTATLNALLVGCSAQQSSMLLDTIYEAMLRAGVQPNPATFRVLIRQSVLNDGIDDAVRYLEDVTRHPGLRVEVEMVLPIMERAARVGDVETVNRVSKFSLDCDIGIDGAVLQNVMKHLAEAGQSVEVLQGHQPLHEALRSRSKAGRRRARSELVL